MILTRTDLHRWFPWGFPTLSWFLQFPVAFQPEYSFLLWAAGAYDFTAFLGALFLISASPLSTTGASHYLLNLLSLIFKPEKTADIWRRHRCMVSPRNAVWGTSTEIPHRWRVTILSWAVLLIGWKFFFNLSKKSTTQLWIVTCHRMDSALLPQTSFCGKTVAAIAKCQPFSQALSVFSVCYVFIKASATKIFIDVFFPGGKST